MKAATMIAFGLVGALSLIGLVQSAIAGAWFAFAACAILLVCAGYGAFKEAGK